MKKYQITAINYLIDNIRATQAHSTVTTHTQKNAIKNNHTRRMKRMEADTISSDFILTTTCKKRTFEATAKASLLKKNKLLQMHNSCSDRKKAQVCESNMNNY